MQIVAIDIHGLTRGFARPLERRDLGGVRIAITETIGEQQRQTSPRFRALGLANGGELEASERLAVPSTGEHSSIVVVLQLAVIRSEGVSRECSHSLELRIENRSVGLGDCRDPARDASLVGRHAQRIPWLVVGSAPNLRAGIGADETSRDSHSASRLSDATAQHISGTGGCLGGRAAGLRRHDEDVRPVEQQQDLLRERGSKLAEVGTATKILERRHHNRRLAAGLHGDRGRRWRRNIARHAHDVELLQHDDREPSQQDGHHEQCANATPEAPVARRLRLARHLRRHRAEQHGSRRLRGRVAAVVRACGEISAARQLDPHRIVASFVGVVLGQAASQAPRLDSHERIGLRIEIRRPAEYFYRDRVALQSFALTGQSLLDDEAQEIRGTRRLLEAAARENPFEPCTYLDSARLGRAGGRRGNVVCRVRNGDHRLVQRQPAAARLGLLLKRQCRRRSRALRRVEKPHGRRPEGYRNGRFGGSERGGRPT